jgi:hypothetical protein
MIQLIALLIVLFAIIVIVGFVMKLVKLGIGIAVILGIAALVYHFFIKKR